MAVSRNFNIAKNIRGMASDAQRTDNIVREHSHTFSSNYTLDSANNGLIAGPIFIGLKYWHILVYRAWLHDNSEWFGKLLFH